MSDEIEISADLAGLFRLALDQGFKGVEEKGGPFLPFTVVLKATGERVMQRFTDREAARASIVPDDALLAYAIVWGDVLTFDDRRWDTVLTEAGEGATAGALLFGQRYTFTPGRLFRKGGCERVGNPALLERPPSRLWRAA